MITNLRSNYNKDLNYTLYYTYVLVLHQGDLLHVLVYAKVSTSNGV